MPRFLSTLSALIGWLGAGTGLAQLNTAFSYQGQLNILGQPANGWYDFQFRLYSDVNQSNEVGNVATHFHLPVSNGVFRASLDFGQAILTCDQAWVEIGVKPAGDEGSFVALTPRQRLDPAPYALRSLHALAAETAVFAVGVAEGGITEGMISPKLATNLVRQDMLTARETAITNSNLLYVDPGGDDSSARRGEARLPFASIGTAVSQARSGDLILIRPGDYHVRLASNNAHILIAHTNLSLQGHGARILTSDVKGDFIWLQNADNIRITGLTLVGGTDPGTNLIGITSGIKFLGARNRNVWIENNRFENLGGHGITHLDAFRGADSNVWIRGNYFQGIGRTDTVIGPDGASVSGIGSKWFITENIAEDCVRGFEVESVGTVPNSAIYIRNNVLMGIREFPIFILSFIPSTHHADIFITHNTIQGWWTNQLPSASAIRIAQGERIWIQDNLISHYKHYGIHAAVESFDIKLSQFTGNSIRGVGGVGIAVTAEGPGNISNCLVKDNLIETTGGSGIKVAGQGIVVTDNLILNPSTNSTDAAIEIRQNGATTTNVTVMRNFVQMSPETSMATAAIHIKPGVGGVQVDQFPFMSPPMVPFLNEGTQVHAILTGSGSPEGVVRAGVGSTFRRLDGTPGATFYVKESGDEATGWVAK